MLPHYFYDFVGVPDEFYEFGNEDPAISAFDPDLVPDIEYVGLYCVPPYLDPTKGPVNLGWVELAAAEEDDDVAEET